MDVSQQVDREHAQRQRGGPPGRRYEVTIAELLGSGGHEEQELCHDDRRVIDGGRPAVSATKANGAASSVTNLTSTGMPGASF